MCDTKRTSGDVSIAVVAAAALDIVVVVGERGEEPVVNNNPLCVGVRLRRVVC
eukprot:m.41305 g.41305  ORF g.41305 m.41305 type:complete len:53 (-) comp11446_c1_seq1:706-864(-)